jgi:hypothetical protein
MEEENALSYQPTELSVLHPERVNDVETVAIGLSCSTSHVGAATG